MGNTVKFEDFKREQERRERMEWLKEHTKEVAAVVSVAGMAISRIYKGFRSMQRHQENAARRRDIYDRSTGMYIHCKREMTANEMLEFKSRKRSGEDPVYILRDMGLLKR